MQAFRDQLPKIQAVADNLRDHRDAAAQAADSATEPVADGIVRWELEQVLHSCP